MFKTGIYREADLENLKLAKTMFGHIRPVSLTLYEATKHIDNGDFWAEQILFLASDNRQTYKRTYCHRFDAFDAICISHISESFSEDEVLNVHDVAVSDARTSCDFFSHIVKKYPAVHFMASDFDATLKIVNIAGMKMTLDSRDQPIEMVLPPFVINLIKPDKSYFYPINFLAYLFANKLMLRRIMRRYTAGKFKEETVIEFFSPQACKLAQTESRFKLMSYDILQPPSIKTPMQVIRAMNVLNPAYFDLKKLNKVVSHLFHALAEGGLLIVGSNGDAGTDVRGGIYKRVGHQFVVLMQNDLTYYPHQSLCEFRS